MDWVKAVEGARAGLRSTNGKKNDSRVLLMDCSRANLSLRSSTPTPEYKKE